MQRIKNWLIVYRLHILIWSVYILYETVVIGLLAGVFGNFWAYATHYAIIIFFFYFQANLTIPFALAKRSNAFWFVPLLLSLQLTAFIIVNYCLDVLLIALNAVDHVNEINFDRQFVFRVLYRGLLFILFSLGYYYLRNYLQERKKSEELERQRLKAAIRQEAMEKELALAQNAFLKAQINPHFLFNTLDFVYHDVLDSSPAAAESIICLANMMRFALDADKLGETIPLADEIEQVENLLYLYRLTKGERAKINFHCDDAVKALHFTPLILLTLTENVLKHGDLTTKGHEAAIALRITDGQFVIKTDNLKDQKANTQGTKNGLNNIGKRLGHAYGDAMVFSCHIDQQHHFVVLIAIGLDDLLKHGESLTSSPGSGRSAFHGSADRMGKGG